MLTFGLHPFFQMIGKDKSESDYVNHQLFTIDFR